MFDTLRKIINKVGADYADIREICREKYFLSSEGTEIREDLITVQLSGLITSRDSNLIQNIRVGTGGSDGFSSVRNQDKLFEENTAIAIDLLKSNPVKGGLYNCILRGNT